MHRQHVHIYIHIHLCGGWVVNLDATWFHMDAYAGSELTPSEVDAVMYTSVSY